MNKILSTTLMVLAILVLAGVIFFAGSMYARVNVFGFSTMTGYGRNNGDVYGPGGMMGRNGMGPTMMGGYGYNNSNLTPLTTDQAKAAADKYLAKLGNPGLEIAEIMTFDNNSYVVVKEASTGIGAFELLVDPVSQLAYPEHGPNMMWNLKYSGLNHQNMTLAPGTGVGGYGGMMNMMGGSGNMMQGWNDTTPPDVNAAMTVTSEQAVKYAQNYLNTHISGATAATNPTQFYGYYTLDFEKDGKVAGMLSVNGYSGQVFLHTWHGAFIEEKEYE